MWESFGQMLPDGGMGNQPSTVLLDLVSKIVSEEGLYELFLQRTVIMRMAEWKRHLSTSEWASEVQSQGGCGSVQYHIGTPVFSASGWQKTAAWAEQHSQGGRCPFSMAFGHQPQSFSCAHKKYSGTVWGNKESLLIKQG